MTPKEATERLKDHFRVHDDGRPTPYLDEAVNAAIVALEKLEKLEDLKWLMENYPIRIGRYDTKNGNRDFVLGVESMRGYVLDVLNGEISVDIEALKNVGRKEV